MVSHEVEQPQTGEPEKFQMSESVIQVLQQIGDFNWEPAPPNDYIDVKKFKKVNLEYGSYEGDWSEEGLRHGRGTQVMNDGALYEGYWSNDETNGRGRLIHSNGDYYEGEFKNAMHHGYGIYKSGNDSKYEGQFFENLMHGEGIETYSDNAVFKGKYKKGKKNGFGQLTEPNGRIYTGNYCDN